MVLMLDGNSDHVAHACRKIDILREKNRSLDLIKCLKQIKQQRLLLTCAPISMLPSSMRTMTTYANVCNNLREAGKKTFFSGPATKALPPPLPRA